MKRPTLTKSARSSSSDNKSGLVAPRDDGKSPRGQDWGPPGTLLRLYILHRGLAMCTLDQMICYATWLLHELYMRITGVSVQPCNGREANHEDKQCTCVSHEANMCKAACHVWSVRPTWGEHEAHCNTHGTHEVKGSGLWGDLIIWWFRVIGVNR